MGCASYRQSVHAMDRVGDAKRFTAFLVGDDSARLPEISNYLLGNDDK